MKYIRVIWRNANSEYPLVLYSELNESGWEIRKVEVYSDGRCGYASETETHGGTFLGIEPVPPLEEIAKDPQFEPSEIKPAEFEEVWARRK